MRWAVSAWICSAICRPSMRFDWDTSTKRLKRVHIDDGRVRPALVEHFFTGHQNALSSEILQREIGGGTVEIVNRLAGIEALERKVSRRLNAHAALHDPFAADDPLDEDFLRWRG